MQGIRLLPFLCKTHSTLCGFQGFIQFIPQPQDFAFGGKADRQGAQERLLEAAERWLLPALDLPGGPGERRPLELLLVHGLPQRAADFVRLARRFDPALTSEQVFQASRNAWAIYSLQVLLGRPVALGLLSRVDGTADKDWIESARYEIDLAGERIPATASLRAPYDPAAVRVRG